MTIESRYTQTVCVPHGYPIHTKIGDDIGP